MAKEQTMKARRVILLKDRIDRRSGRNQTGPRIAAHLIAGHDRATPSYCENVIDYCSYLFTTDMQTKLCFDIYKIQRVEFEEGRC